MTQGSSLIQAQAGLMHHRLGEHAQDLQRFKPDTVPAWRRGVSTKPHPNKEAICNCYLLGKGKSVFPSEVPARYIIHSPGPARE